MRQLDWETNNPNVFPSGQLVPFFSPGNALRRRLTNSERDVHIKASHGSKVVFFVARYIFRRTPGSGALLTNKLLLETPPLLSFRRQRRTHSLSNIKLRKVVLATGDSGSVCKLISDILHKTSKTREKKKKTRGGSYGSDNQRVTNGRLTECSLEYCTLTPVAFTLEVKEASDFLREEKTEAPVDI